jgi:hypothetical protein
MITKIGILNGGRIGLSLAIWERVKWEENVKGWDEGALVSGAGGRGEVWRKWKGFLSRG